LTNGKEEKRKENCSNKMKMETGKKGDEIDERRNERIGTRRIQPTGEERRRRRRKQEKRIREQEGCKRSKKGDAKDADQERRGDEKDAREAKKGTRRMQIRR
jgi:hypothetical protein